jgi:uncharacterized protein (TIGR02099 family)
VNHTPTDESLSLRGLHALAPLAWRLLVVAVVLLAVYVAAGRFLMTQIPALREPLLAQLNEQLPFRVEVGSLSGGWNAFSPELQFSELSLSELGDAAPPVRVGRGSVRLDVPASILAGSLQLSRLDISGLNLEAQLREDGVIEIVGFSRGDGGALRAWLEDFLPNVERVALTDNRLKLVTAGENINFDLNLYLTREGNTRRLEGEASAETLTLAVNARGVGNPLRPLSWTGDVYVDAQSSDLGSMSALWTSLDLPFSLAGAASMQFWLNRADGDSTARMRWDSQALQLDEPGGAWSLPLDALSFEAALDQRARHWSLLTEDFHLERLGQTLDLERAQFDWWGQALRIRASELGLDALPTLLAAAPGLPPGLRDALPELAPRGRLRSIELRLDDLATPAGSWELRSSIEDLEVGSWRNTPALTGVSGYLELSPGRGRLQLDSQNFSMHYPSVYREPQRYDDALGNVYLHWDPEGLRIDSGLMRLAAAEGTASGLFAVDIPFAERVTGVELELLIGLTDSSVTARGKYLPYALPAPLLEWLDRSVIVGDVARAGFIWRGSVLRGNYPHMTVQLFVDARNAELQYDPAWPRLSELDATVWVNDGLTWGRAAHAMSEGAELPGLMVRVIPEPGGALLDIATGIRSDAAVAGRLLTATPLRDSTNAVFEGWTFSGDVAGDLSIALPLRGERQPPRVALDLELDEVALRIGQLDLPIEAVDGALRYRSETGFAGSTAEAYALGGRFALTAPDSEEATLNLQLQGSIDADAVASWLKLPVLRFARGSTDFLAALNIGRDAPAGFSLSSDLQGVVLDAPRPFRKIADRPLPMQLDVPLTADPTLRLSLGERLQMELALASGSLEQLRATVGGVNPEPLDCEETYCLRGTLSSLDITAWSDFYQRYLLAPGAERAAETSAPEPGDALASGSAVAASATPVGSSFTYRIDSLEIGELRFATRSFGQSRVDLWGRDDLWQGALESAAVQGSLTREDGELQLLLEYLDLARFKGGQPVRAADVVNALPDMQVDVLDIRSGDARLGNVGFALDTSQPDGALYATGIIGKLWELDLDPARPGMLRWGPDNPGDESAERSALEVDASFADLGDVLQAAGYAPTIESESGRARLRLAWPGAPSEFAIASAIGSIDLRARNGRVLEARPGALAMITILNFAEILRGLSLTHMFESGIPFDRASTELHLQDGNMEVADLQIDGAASAFAFTGQISNLSDLEKRQVNGELLVTLPVANNLPWVAALAAGPAVAAGVFVVSKVFEKQVNRMSSAVYQVSGGVQSPKLEFRRLFDDKLTPTTAVPEGSGTGGG